MSQTSHYPWFLPPYLAALRFSLGPALSPPHPQLHASSFILRLDSLSPFPPFISWVLYKSSCHIDWLNEEWGGVGGWLLLQPCTPRLSYSVLFLPSPLHIVFRFAYFFLIALTPPSPLPPLTAYSFMSCSGSVDSTKPWHVGPGMNLCSGWNRVPPGLFFYRYYINNYERSVGSW